MKIKIILIGKTNASFIKEGCEFYLKKIKHYCNIEYHEIPDLKQTKNISINEQKIKEGKLILQKIQSSDSLTLLDEKGKTYSSIEFSKYINNHLLSSVKQLIFVIGGPYGFSDEVYKRSDALISLSAMTFSHQMVRLFFLEQIYRGFTILHNEPYHHS